MLTLLLLSLYQLRPRLLTWGTLGLMMVLLPGCARSLWTRNLLNSPPASSDRSAPRGQSPDSRASTAGFVKLSARAGTGTRRGIQPVAYQAIDPVPAESCPPNLYAPSARAGGPCGWACPGCPACGPVAPCPVIVNGPGVVAWDPTHYPDEYLCDGGDRDMPFHYEGPRVGGLETEDTIAEAYDITGKRLVVPSSSVCIYAPRFGALRTISGTSLTQEVQQASGAHDGLRAAGIGTHLAIVEEAQRDQMLQLDVRSRASSIDVESRDSSLHQGTLASLHQQQMAAFQNLTFLKEGQFQQSDLAVLAYGVQAAGMWTRDQFPVLYAHDARGQELEVEFNAAEYVGTEDKRSPGLLRVIKLADKEIARPGDEITFTIRFENVGQRELRGIKIVDNLTPRLEYIANSADSVLPGAVDVEPNGEGSSLLSFRLDEPLAGESSGEVSFRCRVR